MRAPRSLASSASGLLSWARRGAAVGALLAAGGLLSGCPAVYPELSTRTRKLAAGTETRDPPPPDDLRFVKFVSARVPPKTRDGRTWDQVLGSLPDPYAKLLVNGKEVLRTPAQSDTLEPTWPGAPAGNFKITSEDKLRVELWDSNAINDKPVGVRDVGHVSEEHRLNKQIRVELEGGGELVLAFEPAHAMFGLGLWFELRTDSCYLTRMLEGSPAERAGLLRGDQVLRIGDREVAKLSADEIRSAFNSVPSTGLPLLLRHPDGATLTVTLKEGPIYPEFDKAGAVE